MASQNKEQDHPIKLKVKKTRQKEMCDRTDNGQLSRQSGTKCPYGGGKECMVRLLKTT